MAFPQSKLQLRWERCLNCDVQTVFDAPLCEECDACIDICPVECLSIAASGSEEELRSVLSASENQDGQALFVSSDLPLTSRVMIKDENVCLHCGLCAERCPTAAWDMQEGLILINHAQDQEAKL